MKILVYGETVYKITEKDYKTIIELRDGIQELRGFYGVTHKGEDKLIDFLNSKRFKKVGDIDIEYRPG